MVNLKEIGLVVPLLYLQLLTELMQRKYTKQILYDVDIFRREIIYIKINQKYEAWYEII